MLDIFFQGQNSFSAFNKEHLLTILLLAILFFIIIYLSNKFLNVKQQSVFGFALGIFTFLGLVTRTLLYYKLGTFTIENGLPLYVCRLATLFVPFLMWYKNKKLFGILYFWILGGTLQALLTPDLAYGFPHFESIYYWQIHGGLVLVILYAVFVYKMKPVFHDLKNAFYAGVGYLVVIHVINILLGSNYSYTMRKPPVASILDIMGPWPVYLGTGIGVMMVLFLILYLPFYLQAKRSQ